jgi:hypothetical protein
MGTYIHVQMTNTLWNGVLTNQNRKGESTCQVATGTCSIVLSKAVNFWET